MTQLAALVATLTTATGAHVARVEIPPFETGFPPALVWGERFFVRQYGADFGLYAEVFCYAARVEVIEHDDPRRNGAPR